MGTKLVIFGSAIMAGAVAHYGYPEFVWSWNPLEWFRPDISGPGQIALVVAIIAFVWGLRRAD